MSAMVTSHVNEMGIVIRFDTMSENFSSEVWESLLDELKSHYIPSFYSYGKRMHVDFGGIVRGEKHNVMRVVIYFTPNTVSIDESIPILKKRDIVVVDGRVFDGQMLDKNP